MVVVSDVIAQPLQIPYFLHRHENSKVAQFQRATASPQPRLRSGLWFDAPARDLFLERALVVTRIGV